MKEQVFYTPGKGWAKAPARWEHVYHILSKEARLVGAEWAKERVEDGVWDVKEEGASLACLVDYGKDFGY